MYCFQRALSNCATTHSKSLSPTLTRSPAYFGTLPPNPIHCFPLFPKEQTTPIYSDRLPPILTYNQLSLNQYQPFFTKFRSHSQPLSTTLAYCEPLFLKTSQHPPALTHSHSFFSSSHKPILTYFNLFFTKSMSYTQILTSWSLTYSHRSSTQTNSHAFLAITNSHSPLALNFYHIYLLPTSTARLGSIYSGFHSS